MAEGRRRLRLGPPVVRGSGGSRPIRPAPGVFGRGPSDPTAPHYGGAAEEAGSGSGEDRRVRPARGRKLSAGLGPAPETRPPTRTEVLGQKSPRGTPGVPAPLKLRAGPRRPAPPGSSPGQALLFEPRTSSPRQRPRGSRAAAPSLPLAGRADSGEARAGWGAQGRGSTAEDVFKRVYERPSPSPDSPMVPPPTPCPSP